MRKLSFLAILLVCVLCMSGCFNVDNQKTKSLEELASSYVEENRSYLISNLNSTKIYSKTVEDIKYCHYYQQGSTNNTYFVDEYFKIYCYIFFEDGSSAIKPMSCHLHFLNGIWEIHGGHESYCKEN